MMPVAERQQTVMIVDDTPANLAFLSDALDDAGYEVMVARSGQTALRQLELVRPDVILLDAVMPGLDGFETCQRLKAREETREIPVIFMTALTATEDIVRGFGEGAVDYVTKPVREEEILARIASHIARSRSLRRAHGAVEALSRPSLVADRHGFITWRSARACELWPEQAIDALPETALPWLLACAKREGMSPRSFTVEVGSAEFNLDFCGEIERGEFLLTLQRATPPAVELLARAHGLTPREAEVLRWVAAGKTNRDIAEILEMSPRTVTKHLERVFVKLGVETRTAAATRALSTPGLRPD